MQKEVMEGVTAYEEGKGSAANPYETGTREFYLWRDGFFTAMDVADWGEV